MLFVLSFVVTFALLVGLAFVLSKTAPRIPNKVHRFVFLFVLGVLFSFVLNYFDVLLAGYHKMGWIGISIIALLLAALGTFWQPGPRNSNAP
jgi:chromate transport protein ChrA